MANYQQYQRYHTVSNAHRGSKWGKILIILGIVVVLYLIGRSIFGGNSKPTTIVSGGNENVNNAVVTNDNANDNLNGNTNADANSNNNSNANTNSATNVNTAVAGDFNLSKCKEVYSRGVTTEKRISLTFNVGTVKQGEIQNVLDALKAGQAAADFFARGDVAENNPDLISKISSAGFPVYNLSYNYPHFGDLPESGVVEQLTKANTAISQRTNKTTKPFFRPPYGETLSADTVVAITEAGYCPVAWTIDAMDWSTDYTAEQSKERVLSKAANGSIILMQASNAITAQILPDVISQLKTKGYSIVHLEELL